MAEIYPSRSGTRVLFSFWKIDEFHPKRLATRLGSINIGYEVSTVFFNRVGNAASDAEADWISLVQTIAIVWESLLNSFVMLEGSGLLQSKHQLRVHSLAVCESTLDGMRYQWVKRCEVASLAWRWGANSWHNQARALDMHTWADWVSIRGILIPKFRWFRIHAQTSLHQDSWSLHILVLCDFLSSSLDPKDRLVWMQLNRPRN